jgi:5-methylcytosine-specific restriction protein A
MPHKAKHLCSYPGCAELVDGRFCEVHKKQEQTFYNKFRRNPETNKRYGSKWRKIRAAYISAHPLCEECKAQGRLVAAQEIHHIVPLSEGGTNEWANLRALCKSCHSMITAKEGGRWG